MRGATLALSVVLLPTLPALAVEAPLAPAEGGSSDPGSDGTQARGLEDLVQPGDDPDDGGQETSGSSYAPASPSWGSALVVGPALGLLVVSAWILGVDPRSGREGDEASEAPGATGGGAGGAAAGPAEAEVEAREVGEEPGHEARHPEDRGSSDPGGDGDDPPEGQEDTSQEPDFEASGLPGAGDLPGPADPSEAEPGVPRILRLGKEAVDQGDLEDAVEWFETALAAEPDLSVAHLCRGLSLEEMGDYPEAAEAFRSAAEADPGDPAARYLLARSLAEAGQRREALVHLRQVLELVPELTDLARQDAGFDSLRDDPRYLAALGDL